MANAANSTRVPIATSAHWNPPLLLPQRKPTFHLIFLKGQPMSLGIVKISMAFIQAVFGIILVFTNGVNNYSLTVETAITFWGAVVYVISGSLSVAAENTESRCLVRASLGLNIISALVSSVEFVILIIDVVINGEYFCDESCNTIWLIKESSFISLIIASLLELCVSISISSFGCSSLIENSVSQQVFVMPNDGLTRSIQPTSPHQGVHTSAPVTLIPQYPYPPLPVSYESQKNTNITLNNPNINLQPH